MAKKIRKYVPPPVPEVSDAEALAREKMLREQVDTWGVYPRDPVSAEAEVSYWLRKERPGIGWKARALIQKAGAALLPDKPKKRSST